MTKFILYAIVVTVLTSGSTWIRAFSGPGYASSSSRGSSWSSHTGGGGGSYGGGSGGGGHK
jgi:uncharacterized membrane protein